MLRRFVSRALSSGGASPWARVPLAPPDGILGLNQTFLSDPSPRKINLGVGAFRGEDGLPYVLPCVREAKSLVMLREGDNHEYAGISGIKSFCDRARDIALGGTVDDARVVSCQTISGTGALRVLTSFMQKFAFEGSTPRILMPEPTWGNHRAVMLAAGFEAGSIGSYRYWDPATRGIDFEGLCEDLRSAAPGTAVLLHACAHNPTGQDPTAEQWAEISSVCRERSLLVFFDMAYQGFASGDLDRDASALRSFAADGVPLVLAQSFAKNMGLYGERTGALHIVTGSAEEAAAVDSQVKLIVRAMYSNPPIFGAKVVDTVLGDGKLTKMWHDDLRFMADRMIRARSQLRAALEAAGSQHDWSHAEKQTGMFFFSGMTKDQVMALREKSIYLTTDGRISVCGINPDNVEYLAGAMHEVTK